jgi:hypothetical protein
MMEKGICTVPIDDRGDLQIHRQNQPRVRPTGRGFNLSLIFRVGSPVDAKRKGVESLDARSRDWDLPERGKK